MKQEFALYKGDEFLDIGNIEELSIKFNLRPKQLRTYAYPSYIERCNKDRAYILVNLQEA